MIRSLRLLSISLLAFCFSALAENGTRLNFCSTYESCRTEFLENAEAVKGTAGRLFSFKVPSRIDQDLTIDGLYLPPTGTPENLIVLTSGVHGVEGYVGNLVQQIFLKEVLPTLDRTHTGVLLVHGINPYGMKYLRRVSENNVDLNRNFDTDSDLFSTPNEAYRRVSSLLNPAERAKLGDLARLDFYWGVGRTLMNASVATLRQAVLQGQYEIDHGVYFGGKQFEPQKRILEDLLTEVAKPYRNVLALDVHTGYGPRGKLVFMTDPPTEAEASSMYERVFQGFTDRHLPSSQDYKNLGDFALFAGKLLRSQNKNVVPMVLEYGTVDNHTTLGGIQSLRTMVLENQLQHNGAVSRGVATAIKKRFMEMYFPAAPSWREQFVAETRKLLPFISRRFTTEGDAQKDCGETLKNSVAR